jgi:hypothetical protein
MATLKDVLLDPAKRPGLVRDCTALVDDEVAKKSGFSGMAVKMGFKVLKGVKPGIVASVVDGLLDEWVANLEDHFTRWQADGKGASFGAFASRDAGNVAERLLAVTDARAKKVDNPLLVKTYNGLRPTAKEHVVAGVPGLGRVVDRYL